MSEPMPVFIWIGASEEERKEKDPLIQAAITAKEKEFGRPLNTREILQTFGEVIEPDPAKRTFIQSSPPTKMPPLRQ